MASGSEQPQAEAEPEAVELVLFQVAECYVYLVFALILFGFCNNLVMGIRRALAVHECVADGLTFWGLFVQIPPRKTAASYRFCSS